MVRSKRILDNKKPPGRPKTTGTGTLVGVRLLREMLNDIDAERGERSRPEAIRTILAEHFKKERRKPRA